MTAYYIVKNGKPFGPLSLSELRTMGLVGTDFIKEDGWDDYKELREIPDLSAKLGIAYERALPQYYATLDVRLLAAAIDYFFAFLIYCCFALAIVIKAEHKQEQWTYLLFGLLTVPLFKFIICVIGEGSAKNASPGKLLLQIKVTDTKGNPIGFGRALWRNMAKITGLLTLGVSYLIGFMDRKQQCVHDKLARTLVIKGRLI
ncbi:RDD family protein [Olivibacter sp. LS-1]|uniref:RDD family protein n=1 Tax=Olivibacter sp. LS-1 TaxID=2592345 RepID=UPI0011EB282D|nr:RDD family protein [Olivibacter sp. LS-1]QEL00247.1 RDD family protein [Olivibacter sp. LS-1]